MKSFHFSCKVIFLASLFVMLPITALSQATLPKDNTLGDYTDSHIAISDDGHNMHLTLVIKPSFKLKAQEVLYIYPRLVSQDGTKSIELNSIAIAGVTRYKVMKRRHALNNITPDEPRYNHFYSYKEVEHTPLTIAQDIPLQEWMSNAELTIHESFYGCAECHLQQSEGVATAISTPIFGEKYYAYDFIQPEKVVKRDYESSCDCRINFGVGQHDIKSHFRNNEQELATLHDFIDQTLSIEGATLKEVIIRGYASPEGNVQYNKDLSQRRTNALYHYLLDSHPMLKQAESHQIVGMGEDWEGIKKALRSSTLHNSTEIITIIDRYDNDIDREAAIRNIDRGATYTRILREIYPSLRRSTLTLRLELAPSNEQELSMLYETKPESLSHYDLFLLAKQYERDGKDPTHVYKTAHDLYPEDPTATLNLANALLKYRQDANKAIETLESIKDDQRSLFPMAIAYDLKGNKAKAKELIKKASDSHSAPARAFLNASN